MVRVGGWGLVDFVGPVPVPVEVESDLFSCADFSCIGLLVPVAPFRDDCEVRDPDLVNPRDEAPPGGPPALEEGVLAPR